jgi:hypothetical protein
MENSEVISKSKLEKNRNVRKSNPRGRPKGLPKTGGRKKAVVEDTSHWDEVLKNNLFSIPQEAMKLYFDKDTSNALKFSILQFLAEYTTPAIKPQDKELQLNTEPPINSSPQDILKIVNDK